MGNPSRADQTQDIGQHLHERADTNSFMQQVMHMHEAPASNSQGDELQMLETSSPRSTATGLSWEARSGASTIEQLTLDTLQLINSVNTIHIWLIKAGSSVSRVGNTASYLKASHLPNVTRQPSASKASL